MGRAVGKMGVEKLERARALWPFVGQSREDPLKTVDGTRTSKTRQWRSRSRCETHGKGVLGRVWRKMAKVVGSGSRSRVSRRLTVGTGANERLGKGGQSTEQGRSPNACATRPSASRTRTHQCRKDHGRGYRDITATRNGEGHRGESVNGARARPSATSAGADARSLAHSLTLFLEISTRSRTSACAFDRAWPLDRGAEDGAGGSKRSDASWATIRREMFWARTVARTAGRE